MVQAHFSDSSGSFSADSAQNQTKFRRKKKNTSYEKRAHRVHLLWSSIDVSLKNFQQKVIFQPCYEDEKQKRTETKRPSSVHRPPQKGQIYVSVKREKERKRTGCEGKRRRKGRKKGQPTTKIWKSSKPYVLQKKVNTNNILKMPTHCFWASDLVLTTLSMVVGF